MKILICDPVDENALNKMKSAGLDITVKTGMTPEELEKTVPNFNIMVVRSATKARENILRAGKDSLKLIVRGGVGLDNIDLKAAKELNIEVRNTPSASSASVAEMALAHIFALYRFLPRATLGMKNNKWEKKALKGREVSGKTLGIIGIGRIGFELAKKALALGMKVIAYDLPIVKESPLKEVELHYDINFVLKNADIISLHLPFNDKTKNMINKDTISLMKKGSIIVNCARGGIINEQDLADAINEGYLAGAGIDVFENEPIKEDNPLLKLDNISLTPHIGGSTKEGQARVGQEVADIIIEFCK